MQQIDDLDCSRHPDMAACLVIDMSGEVSVHSHIGPANLARALDIVLADMRADLAAEALRADLP